MTGRRLRLQMCPTIESMDEETLAVLRSIAHHLKWVIVLLLAILGLLVAESLARVV